MSNILTSVVYINVQNNVKVLCGAKAFIGTNLVLSCRIFQNYSLPGFLLFLSLFEIKYFLNVGTKSRITKGLSF